MELGEDFLRAVAPRFRGRQAAAQGRIIAAIAPVLSPTLAAHGIDRFLRIAHFMAQVVHECAGFRTTEEFASGAAYEGRADLGNLRPGDGVRYKGRGLIQLTGRANYARAGARLGLPLEAEPALAAEPVTSLRIACDYWVDRGINAPADRDDLEAVTRRVNGGLNGLADRRALLVRARRALVTRGLAAPPPDPVLRPGATGPAVVALQGFLAARAAGIVADGVFGPATEAALRAFQTAAGLSADAVAGPRTWAALRGRDGRRAE